MRKSRKAAGAGWSGKSTWARIRLNWIYPENTGWYWKEAERKALSDRRLEGAQGSRNQDKGRLGRVGRGTQRGADLHG